MPGYLGRRPSVSIGSVASTELRRISDPVHASRLCVIQSSQEEVARYSMYAIAIELR